MDADGEEAAAWEEGTVELPCFEKATYITLRLGHLGLAVPPAGVFARLITLNLSGVRFDGPCELGDAVSSPRCPCLEWLTICNTRGLDSLTVDSQSLVQMRLSTLVGLRRLVVVAPALMRLTVASSASYTPLQVNQLPTLRLLGCDFSSGEIGDYQYLMDDMTMLPEFTILHLVLNANGHAFEASSFHVLRMCTSIRRLILEFSTRRNFKDS
ncbi:hypothetical protein EJB05_14011, partial [Eragrostis curvula]